VVLDVDDSAGYNAQLAQSTVDTIMKQITRGVNDTSWMRDAGIQLPREYLPEDTLEWRLKLSGPEADERRDQLIQQYIGGLDVNSNGATIIRSWKPLDEVAQDEEEKERNNVLWVASGKSPVVYDTLNKWWWLILLLAVVVVVTVGLGVGLSARHRRRANR
jgi:hypothetical protein